LNGLEGNQQDLIDSGETLSNEKEKSVMIVQEEEEELLECYMLESDEDESLQELVPFKEDSIVASELQGTNESILEQPESESITFNVDDFFS